MSGPLAEGLALILDMDGVVIDSNPLHRRAWELFNLRYGLETTEEMHQRMYGKRNDQIIRDFYGADLDEAEVFARGAAKEQLYRELMEERVEECLVPGVREFLQRYKGTPMGLATNAEPPNVEFVLRKAVLGQYFQVVVDGHQVERPKPDPEVYLTAAQLLGIPPCNAIVFEDSHSGAKAGGAAGMRVIGIRTTYGRLPGTLFDVDNFKDGKLEEWLRDQRPLV